MKTKADKPTHAQVFAAKVRAESEAFTKRHRRPFMGGYEVPNQEKVYRHLAKVFGIPTHEVARFGTYSRSCDHPWSKGACKDCPSADHLYCPTEGT